MCKSNRWNKARFDKLLNSSVTNVDGEALMERPAEPDQDELLECGECGQEYTRADSPRVDAGMKCGQCAT